MDHASPRILILYASYGSGHLQAAHAIEAELRHRGIHEVQLLDLMAEAHPLLNEVSKFIYMRSLKTFPGVYGWIYQKTRYMKQDSILGSVLESISSGRLNRQLAETRPDVVIHTFPQTVMPRLPGGAAVPVVTVLTDYDLHSRWLHPGADRLYVATDDLKREAAERGFPEEKIIVTGIPLLPFFRNHENSLPEPKRVALGLSLDPIRKTVLLMGGADGAIRGCTDICRRLEQEPDLQVVVICGKNKTLYRQLAEVFASSPHVHILGYVEPVHQLMKVSSCMITKPGGITVTECIACRLPLFLYRPFPGQERGNALYLERQGAAIVSHTPEQLAKQVCGLLRNREAADTLKGRMGELFRPDAAGMIVDDLFSQVIPGKPELAPAGI